MNSDIMKKLRETEIEILDYIVTICNEYNIQYYLAYGSVLGAIRHTGFIPWDDDIDICLPRNEYVKLCKILEERCNNTTRFFFQSWDTDSRFYMLYSKLRKNGTTFLEEKNESSHNGVFVDIFPLDSVSREYGIQKVNVFIIFRLLSIYKKCKVKECDKASEIIKRIILYLQCSTYKKSKYYVNYSSVYKVDRDVIPIEWFGSGRKHKFEKNQYIIPSIAEKYLERIYGADYMELPPVEKRITHEPQCVEFEKN